jgi:hypothetical protein
MPKLKAVVLDVDEMAGFFVPENDGVDFPLFYNKFISYLELVKDTGLLWAGRLFVFDKCLYSSLLGQTHGRGFFLGNLQKTFFKKVKFRLPRAPEDANGRAAAEAAAENIDLHFRGSMGVSGRELFYFKKILRICRQKGLEVFTVQSPKSSAYLEHIDSTGKKQAFQRGVLADADVAAMVKRNFDFYGLFPGRRDLFQENGQLLNAKGREVFSAELEKSVCGELGGKK